MRRVRVSPQSIDDPHIQPLKVRQACGGHVAQIRRIGNVANAKAKGVGVAMGHGEGYDRKAPPFPIDLDRVARHDQAGFKDRRIGASVRCFETIGKARHDQIAGDGVEIDRHFCARVHGDGPKVVDAVGVVGVLVGEQHPIKGFDSGIEQLDPHVGRSIDQYCGGPAAGPLAPEQNRAAAAVVPGVFRIACPPMAADARHAAR